MTDVMSVLIWRLKAATGLEVYPAPIPTEAIPPCLSVQMISDPMQDNNNQAAGQIHKSRVQIGHIGDYKVIRPYVQTVQNYLEGNKTDFLSCLSGGNYQEIHDADNLWSLVKDYLIQWKY